VTLGLCRVFVVEEAFLVRELFLEAAHPFGRLALQPTHQVTILHKTTGARAEGA